MAKKYQMGAKMSTRKFEMVGDREFEVEAPLSLVEVWEDLQPQAERLT